MHSGCKCELSTSHLSKEEKNLVMPGTCSKQKPRAFEILCPNYFRGEKSDPAFCWEGESKVYAKLTFFCSLRPVLSQTVLLLDISYSKEGEDLTVKTFFLLYVGCLGLLLDVGMTWGQPLDQVEMALLPWWYSLLVPLFLAPKVQNPGGAKRRAWVASLPLQLQVLWLCLHSRVWGACSGWSQGMEDGEGAFLTGEDLFICQFRAYRAGEGGETKWGLLLTLDYSQPADERKRGVLGAVQGLCKVATSQSGLRNQISAFMIDSPSISLNSFDSASLFSGLSCFHLTGFYVISEQQHLKYKWIGIQVRCLEITELKCFENISFGYLYLYIELAVMQAVLEA